MSTKIYKGFRLKFTDTARLMAFLRRQRAEFIARAHDEAIEFVARTASRHFDRAWLSDTFCLSPLQSRVAPLFDAIEELSNRQSEIKKSGHRDPEVDFNFSLALFPHGGQLYGIAYCDQSEWVRSFKTDPDVEEFAYWDNTDPPDNISAADWSLRREIWEQILDVEGGYGIPALCGFTADIVITSNLGRISAARHGDAITSAVPSFDERLQHAGKSLALARLLKPGAKAENSFEEIMQKFYSLEKENRPVLEAAKADIGLFLKETLTREDLLRTFEPTQIANDRKFP